MRLKLFSLIGALLITMSASASAGTLVLETSKGEVRIALLETIAPNHVARALKSWLILGFIMVLSFTA